MGDEGPSDHAAGKAEAAVPQKAAGKPTELFGDPTVPGVADHLEARIVAVLKNYPLLDYIWFFQNEEASRKGWDVPKGSEVERLIREEGETFAYLGNPKRIAEARPGRG